jgi:hypothetical protein
VRSINNFTEVIFRNQFFKNHVDSTFTKSVIDLIGHHFITDQLIGIITTNILCGSKIAITLKILTIIILFL